MFLPHFGVDESGKGDFFGPLVIAGVYTDAGIARQLLDAGVMDSKRISGPARIRQLAEIIRNTPGALHEVVSIGPERYNEMHASFGNLNRLLAWGHARVIGKLLERKPECPRALSDQFARPEVLEGFRLPDSRKRVAQDGSHQLQQSSGGAGVMLRPVR